MEIDVFSDVVCPWCLIGTARLERVLADMKRDAVIRFHPFLLRPDTPSEGIDIHRDLRRKYGASLDQIWERLHAMAKEMGIALDLSKQPRTYPTVRAHTLIRHASEKGTQRALARALFDAYFLDAKNISDVEVLVTVAEKHGFTADEARALLADDAELEATRREANEAGELGIRGVPLFVFDGKVAISGAQPESAFREAIARSAVRDSPGPSSS